MDRAWAFATAIININTGENYTVNDVKKMDKNRRTELAGEQRLKEARREPHGARELERRTGIPHTTIGEHLKLLDLEPEIDGKEYVLILQDISRKSYGYSFFAIFWKGKRIGSHICQGDCERTLASAR